MALLSLTAHWISDALVRQNIVLCAEPLSESHTGDYLAGKILFMLESFAIGTDRVHVVLRDVTCSDVLPEQVTKKARIFEEKKTSSIWDLFDDEPAATSSTADNDVDQMIVIWPCHCWIDGKTHLCGGAKMAASLSHLLFWQKSTCRPRHQVCLANNYLAGQAKYIRRNGKHSKQKRDKCCCFSNITFQKLNSVIERSGTIHYFISLIIF